MTPEEADKLPPTQYLMMEVLAGRFRTGEKHWTFPAKLSRVARALEKRGLVWWKFGVVRKTIWVGMTREGVETFIDPRYHPPRLLSGGSR